MAEQGVLVTGGGGFLGRFVLDRYLRAYSHDLYLLEQDAFLPQLQAYLAAEHSEAVEQGRVHIIEGDITRTGLGVAAPARALLREQVTAVVHLAALYHLAAPRDALLRVNVEGVRNVLYFIQALPHLKRFAHVSSLAVAGAYEGVFDEKDFDKGQRFSNYYEESKFLAEKLVRERMTEIPTAIFRPSVIVGHSKTGYIAKLDGPYYFLTALARNIHRVMPDCGPVKCYVAPVDFVADAIVEVFENDAEVLGTVCCLTDADPVTWNAFLDIACDAWPTSRPLLRVPWKFVRPLAKRRLFEWFSGVPWQAFLYGNQRIEHTFPESARRLAERGLRCPSPPEYIQPLIAYYKAHRRDDAVRRGDWRNVVKYQ